MRYPATITCDQDGCTVTFPDLPGAITCGATEEEALLHAMEALESALNFYFDHTRPIPIPSAPKHGQRLVELPSRTSALVRLFNDLVALEVGPDELSGADKKP